MNRISRTILAIVLVVVLSGVIAACGGNDATPEPTPTPVPTVAPPTEAPAAAATEEATEAAAAEEAATEEAVAEAATEAAETEEATAEETSPEATEEVAAEEATEEAGAEATEEADAEATVEATATEAAAAEAAPAGPISVESARPVTAVVNESAAYLAAVSPDGSSIAWVQSSGRGRNQTGQVCLFQFSSAAKNCYDLSRDAYQGYPEMLYWSPDSTSIAFTENPLQFGSESDIWLFSAADGSFTDLTDDGVVGNWMAEVGNQEFWLDYLPMWNQADGMIYFWRVVPQGNGVFTTGVYRIDPAGGEAEEVSDLTAALNNQVPFFDYQAIFLDGMSTIAPDGSKAAVVLASYGDTGYVELSIWTLDLAAADSAPTQILTQTDLGAAVPEWGLSFPATPNGLAWTADSNGLVVLALANTTSPQTPFQVFYYVDAASGASTPVVDFSQLADYDAYFETAPGTQIPWRFYSPWTASLAPDGTQLLMVNDLGGVVAMMVAPLPPTGDLPSVNATADESPMSGSTVSSRAADGKVIMYDLLLNLIQ